MVLSGISVSFAISWLPLHIFLLVTEHVTVFQVMIKISFNSFVILNGIIRLMGSK
jgi:hypothetical protein